MTDKHENAAPWLSACRMVAEQQYMAYRIFESYWLTCLGMQERLMHEWLALLSEHHPYRRWHAELARGADIMDHYGHRAHDVDPERI